MYITTLAAIKHGVSVEKRSFEDRSIAIQFRALLDSDAGRILDTHKALVSAKITEVLKECPFRAPSFIEWEETLNRLKNTFQQKGLTGESITVRNEGRRRIIV
jgi:hypothetical protein